ncbi:hydantoinase B/oxoprolinase family protein [Paradesulfitobacterium ferrireducens]|uniref:hydantoinase B/oxoprolinase family protein n=1 Tax=Paradesulfitobacterium ferrireducens TaxID=2816476 RepID=UPI001A90752D|nr:hydantoinase B/oxoprolinase family protein [Paradesulfitobacterium ferrireducens]
MPMQKLDPVKYEIFYNRLSHILNEGKEVLRYLSGSTIAREGGEVAQAFYLPTGEAVHIACGILMHILNVTRVIRYMRANNYEAEDIGIYDGDQFINNDAYIGGMHAPDMANVAPIFYNGELIGYTASISHTTETGGIEPGGMCPSALEAVHDGIHLPALKLIERGRMKQDVFNMILRSVRDPRAMELDIRARIAANERVRQRILELIEEVGPEFFITACKQLVHDAAEQLRAKVKMLKPGVYKARIYNDTVGVLGDKLAIIQVELGVTKEGELHVKVPVVSPQVRGFNNSYLPAVEASVFYTLLVEMAYDLRWNSGISDIVHIEVPEKSRLNADEKQSVGYATVGIAQAFTNALTEAIGRAYFASGQKEEVMASGAVVCCGIWGGIDQYGRPCGNILSQVWPASGSGGRHGRDGIDSSFQLFNPWSYSADTEGEEVLMPVLHWSAYQRPDSGGYGAFRGGCGISAIDIVHGSERIETYVIGTGGKIPINQGIFGGYPGGSVYSDRINNSNFFELMNTKQLPYTFKELRKKVKGEYVPGPPSIPSRLSRPGDIIMYSSIGGGGLGDPLERNPQSIVDDIKNGVATLEISQKVYCVALNPQTLEINQEETKALREAKKRERLRQGVPAITLLRSLVQKRKERQISEVAQSYLDELTEFSTAFKQELEHEEKISALNWEPIGRVGDVEKLFELTPYVNVGKTVDGKLVTYCGKCGFIYGGVKDNFKLFTLVYERDPQEVYPGDESGDRMAPDKDWCILREFYCPGCGTQIEVEATPPGTPFISNYSINFES